MTIDAQILFAMREAGQGGVSGAELSRKLGISRAAIWARIEELRSLGYDIEASPHLGYRLISVPDVLHEDDLLSRLPRKCVIGREIRVFERTTSTNDVVTRLAQDGAKEGFVVFAESQSKGRGRLGRTWLSPARKGLWFSILLRPELRPQAVTQLTVAAATSLVRAFISTCGIAPEIKWPNDILINGKKVAGILTEMNAELDHVRSAILGIGVDVNLERNEFPPELQSIATSLRIEAGHPISRAEIAASILRELDKDYAKINSGGFESIADEWRENCGTIGRNVSIQIGARTIQGSAEALDSDGALLVRTQHGRLERITGGDVTLEKW